MGSRWEQGVQPQPDSGQDTHAAAEALAATEDLASVPVAEHVARFEAVHRALSDALSSIDGQ
jgi:hypothetical protein